MRSYEDRWNWLRAQLEDDAAVLDVMFREHAVDYDRSRRIDAKLGGIRTALRHMDDADRNGPVEPL